jgi:signal transduction histidine kinase
MKIRSHLVLLVLAAVLPVLAFSAVMAAVFWRHQRTAFEQRYLERVRAMAIALDRQLEGDMRALGVLGFSAHLERGDMRAFYEQARRIRAEQPGWEAIILADTTGAQVVSLRRPFGTPLPAVALGQDDIARIVATRRPVVSGLVAGAMPGGYTTNIGVPVIRQDVVTHVLIAAIAPPTWLEFLGRYPVAPDATMTLLDQDGIVIARTLNNDRWRGQRPAPALYEASRRMAEGAYRSVGLEGQWFYSAHSRSTVSGWTVATGVPLESVEQELRASTLAMASGAALVGLLAVGLAILFGRRISRPVVALGRAAAAFDAGRPPEAQPASAITEVDEVARVFREVAERLRGREAALRESEAESRTRAAEAEAASRAKDEFLMLMSHELRTPLNSVYGWARMLRAGQVPDEAQRARALETIERNANIQVQLIDDLLDVARMITGKMRLEVQPVDLSDVIEAALDAVRPAAAAKDLRLESAFDPKAGPVAGDPGRLQQVVWNLLSNAVKFTPNGGRVGVQLHRVNAHVEIVVSDTGTGIAPEVLPFIFDRFRQANSSSTRAHGGLGLGLALVKHLVELHGGSVSAQSPGEEKGATFVVKLPAPVTGGVRTPAPRVHAPAGSRTPMPPGARLDDLRVLVVDDDGDAVELARAILREAGATVRSCLSVPEALDVLGHWRPDVLVADIEMPGEDGYSLIRKVRTLDPERGGKIPAIALTAYGRTEDRVATLAAGYSMHVPKPVDPAELTAIIAGLAGRAG